MRIFVTLVFLALAVCSFNNAAAFSDPGVVLPGSGLTECKTKPNSTNECTDATAGKKCKKGSGTGLCVSTIGGCVCK